MLVELSMVEQRYLAVRGEVLDTGASVTDVATRYRRGQKDLAPLARALRQRETRCAGRPPMERR